MSAWSLRSLWQKRAFRIAVGVVALTGLYRLARKPLLLPSPPKPDAETFAQAQRVRIVRDTWGVPHVFGTSDADAAFGLAYANAEDDFPMIQGVLAASYGRLALLSLSKDAWTGMRVSTEAEREALAIVQSWNGEADESSVGATIAILVWRMVRPDYTGAVGSGGPTDAQTAFRMAVRWLVEHYGKVAVPLGEVQRLVHGKVNLPLGGGPDVINGIAANNDGRHRVGARATRS